MARTPSNMVPIGFKAPHFNLLNTKSGKILSLENLAGEKCTLIMFICNHCPFVIHINEEIVNIANEYIKKGVSFIAISSNDIVNYPQDSPEKMSILTKEKKIEFPYFFDHNQDVAHYYKALCTPEFLLFDKNHKLFYHGRYDKSRPKNGIEVTGQDLKNAINKRNI